MKRILVLAAIAVVVLGCNQEKRAETKEKVASAASKVADKVQDAFDPSTPIGKADPNEAKAREQQRFDQQWRQLQSFRNQQAAQQQQQAQQAAAVAANIQFVSGQKQTFKNADLNAINGAPVSVPISGDVRGPSVLKAQVFLDRVNYSVGSIDGRWGRNSAISVWWWQRGHGLPPTGDVDQATFTALAQAAGNVPAVVSHTLTADDVKGPFVSIPEDVYDQQSLDCLCYESLREKLAEKFHSTEDFLEVLNPDVKFSELQAGQSINVPNVRPPLTQDQKDIAKVVISIAGNSFNAFDANGALILHAPSTLGSGYDPSPDETVQVKKIIHDPHFHYDPTLYHEVPDSNPDAHLKPGPNSPVGVVWIALSKPHYGVHGTKDPDAIGYASSHGCIRLTNWDANDVEHRISEGTQISFVDTSSKGLPEVAKKD
jgi:lipoprotein-anchoring transpeptidase ErfK/SrfK